MVEVVAALIWNQDRFLICQRPANKARGLLWEFVGGKVESGETKTDALVRECEEELDIMISVHDVFVDLVHTYPDITIHLTLFNASIQSGVPKKIEHNDLRWITTEEIDQFQFCPADADILKMIRLRYQLFSKQDLTYKAFYEKLIPNIDADKIIGVRVPELRKLIRLVVGESATFLTESLPHKYYEEDMLHSFIISQEQDFLKAVQLLDEFLPYVDNWAVCDSISPITFHRQTNDLMEHIKRWIRTDHVYTVRFGIGMLLKYFLDENFSNEQLILVANVRTDEYYIKMMVAWYFATALVKQYENTLQYLLQHKLDIWTHNKTIQKAIESNRITNEQKAYLRTLKHKQSGI